MKGTSSQQSGPSQEPSKMEEDTLLNIADDGNKRSVQKTPKKATTSNNASTNATTATKLNANGTPKRQKIVKACRDCRRRKVKCDGGTPCSTCRRSSIPCLFEATSPKKSNGNSNSTGNAAAGTAGLATTAAATKHYIESLENKISIIERALYSLGEPTVQLVEQAMRREQLHKDNRQKMANIQQVSGLGLSPLADDKNKFFINELGSAQYMQDIISATVTNGIVESQSSSSPSPVSSKSSNIIPQPQPPFIITDGERNHIQFYFIQLQPYFPLFVPTLFNRQFQLNEIPCMLVHAICMLSSLFQQTCEDEVYYQKTMLFLDEAVGRPSIALVQTLLLVIKYLECSCTTKSQFLLKSKSLLGRAMDLCSLLLNLHQPLSNLSQSDNSSSSSSSSSSSELDIETRKRTFFMVFAYQTLLCVEQGPRTQDVVNMMTDDSLPRQCMPTAMHADESLFMECQRCIVPFIATLSKVHQHIQRVTQRQQLQKEKRTEVQVVEERATLLQLQAKIDNDYMSLPAQFLLGAAGTGNIKKKTKKQQQQPIFFNYPFPVPEKEEGQQAVAEAPANGITHIVSPMTRFIHLLYYLSIVLLHFHYFMYPLPTLPVDSNEDATDHYDEDHRQMCLSAASNIIRLVEYLWFKDVQKSYQYMPRGIHLLIYSLMSALTILKVAITISTTHGKEKEDIEKEYQRCASLLQQISLKSPFQEIRAYAEKLVDANGSGNASISSMNTSPSPTHYIQPLVSNVSTANSNKRRNTISSSGYYNMVPTSLLHSSSTDIYSQPYAYQHHQPLNNIHTMPLQMGHYQLQQQQQQSPSYPKPLLRRGMAQSCQDLRSMHYGNNTNNLYAHHRRNPSVISSNSSISASLSNYNTTRPYRQGSVSSNQSSRTVSPSLPYVKPTTANAAAVQSMAQQQQQAPFNPFIPVATPTTIHQSKMKRVKKSTSIHGLSEVYQQQQEQQQQQQLQYRHSMHLQPTLSALQPQTEEDMFPSQPFNRYPLPYTQQPMASTVEIIAPSIPMDTTTTTSDDDLLHRPYQPSLDDDMSVFPLIGQNVSTNNKKFLELLYANQASNSGGMMDTTMLDANMNFLDTTSTSANMMMLDYNTTQDATSVLISHNKDTLSQQQQQYQ